MRLKRPATISFRCSHCHQDNEGEEGEFRPRATMPPSWEADCAFCRLTSIVFPTALIARSVGHYLGR